MEREYIAVRAVKDDSGHWYIIPNSLLRDFRDDEENEEFVSNGGFDARYGKYRTGGDLNLVQLYIEA